MKTKQSLVFSGWSLVTAIIIISSFILPPSSLRSQIVVPKGWENIDSLRFGLFGVGKWSPQIDSLVDTLGCTFEEEFGLVDYNAKLFGHRKGYMGFVSGNVVGRLGFIDLAHVGISMYQRIYYASPDRISLGFDNGYFWRYNDIRFNPKDTFHNNTYDANDISLYTEYPRNDDTANVKYFSHQLDSSGHTTGDTVTVGNQGRVILGYSDNRFAQQLLRTSDAYWHLRDTTPAGVRINDTAKTFSATLEFNIDTANISTSGSALPRDSVPLLRFQILYKQGEKDSSGHVIVSGWSVLPFVPFKDSSHLSNVGWYKVIDTTITYAAYKTLPDDWRQEDVLENGSLSHPTWHFKQLHVMLTDMPQSMRDLIKMSSNMRTEYGGGTDSVSITTVQHPDSLVAARMDSAAFFQNKSQYLLETRVLSTYRATVRVRSMEWQDTTVDKILYRKLDTATHLSYSCNPDGTRGGWDSVINQGIKQIHDSCAAYGTQMREYIFNDNWAPFGPLSASGIGYIDYFLSKYGMNAHPREQEYGANWSQQYRRERLGYDGKPPGMFENQVGGFYQSTVTVFPSDYVANAISLHLSTPWPLDSNDIMAGLQIGRLDLSGSTNDDTIYAAYKKYTDHCAGLNLINSALRNSVKLATFCPPNRRFAIESNIQGWGNIILINDTDIYTQRQTTPEETSAMIYDAIANGITSLSVAQPFDDVGLFGHNSHNNVSHSFNFGRLDTISPPYYLGYSNSYRAYLRAIGRINQIYDTTGGRKEIPFRRFTWMNAYSANFALSTPPPNSLSANDSINRITAFLKCFKATQIKRWSRDSIGGYIDSVVVDSAQRTYVEVGLFKDSINAKQKNYAALVVNTRLWPALRDSVDIKYYNNGLDSAKDRCKSTLGDIDTRRVFFKIDTNQMDPSARATSYYVHDLWKPDSTWLVSNDTISVYIKPGDAKFLYITPATSLNLGVLSDNLYNNGRHIAAIDTSAQGIKQYVMTYARNGKICVACPIETPSNPDRRIAGTPVDSVIWLDSSGLAYNPSIAFNHNDNSIGVTWRKIRYHCPFRDSSCYGFDTTFICFAYASYTYPNTFTFSPMKVLDTLLQGWVSLGAIPSPPAIAPRDTSYDTLFRKCVYWVAYNCNDSGETLLLVDTGGHVRRKTHFCAPDHQFPYHKFVSIATHVPYDTVHIAFEEGLWGEGQIYYTRGYIDSTHSLITSPTPVINISNNLRNCENFCPQIAMSPNNLPEVGWEAIERFAIPPDTLHNKMLKHSAVLRTGYNGSWSDFTTFLILQQSYIDTLPYTQRIYVNVCSANYDDTVVITDFNTRVPWQDWPDRKRLTWNNLTTGAIELARFGRSPLLYPPESWGRYYYPDQAWEPSMPTLSFGNLTSHVFSYRGIVQHGEGYDARITRYPFPSDTVGNSNIIEKIRAFPHIETCNPIIMNAKMAIVMVKSSLPTRTIPFHSLSDSANDPHATTPISWDDKKAVRTYGFHISAGDSIKYQRSFSVGEYLPGDRISVADSLKGSTDFLRARIYLRRAVNDSILKILDSAQLKQSGTFIQTAQLSDSCLKRYKSTFTDSVYITMEFSRGDPTNQFQLSHIESYDDYFQGSTVPGDSLSYKTSSPKEEQVPLPENVIKVTVIPNPFNSSTKISVDASKDIPLNVSLFDELGHKIAELNNGPAVQAHSEFAITSQSLSSGFYYLRVQSGSQVVTRKIELLK